MLTILEAARISLADAEIFDTLAEDMDITDKELLDLRERLQNYLDEPAPVKSVSLCKQCGSELVGGFCKDATCPYSDWPQIIDMDDFWFECSDGAIEKKYKIQKRQQGELAASIA
jgi:hypothetical protein